MQPEESAVSRSRRPILLVEPDADEAATAEGGAAGPDGAPAWSRERLSAAALDAGFVVRKAPSLHRACVQLGRADEQVDALVLFAGAGAAVDAVEHIRAVRRVRGSLPIVMATLDAATAHKLEGELEACGISGVHPASPATPEAILERLRGLRPG